MAAHSNPDDRNFCHVGCAVEPLIADLRPCIGYRILGSLEVGKLADVTVLSRDIMTIPEDDILSTDIVYTIVGGKLRYDKTSGLKR